MNSLRNNLKSILIIGVLVFMAFQLNTLNNNVKNIEAKLVSIDNSLSFYDLPTDSEIQNIKKLLDDILKCSDRYVGLRTLSCP